MTEKQEARLLGRAIKRWDIPESEKENTIGRLIQLRDQGEREGTRLAASRALMDAEAMNQKDEHKFVDIQIQREHDRLAHIASELGIEESAVEDASRSAISSTSCNEGANGGTSKQSLANAKGSSGGGDEKTSPVRVKRRNTKAKRKPAKKAKRARKRS